MYITLSSKNEPSNSRFTNKFLDNIVLPPNSTVSLISATINQTNIEEKIVVPANSYIYLRITGASAAIHPQKGRKPPLNTKT